MVSEDAQQAFSEELLGLYYSRLFPYEAMTRWLSYGNDANAKGDNPHNDMDYLKRREVSFTLKDDIYIRYLCFRDAEDMKLNMTKKRPYKVSCIFLACGVCHIREYKMSENNFGVKLWGICQNRSCSGCATLQYLNGIYV